MKKLILYVFLLGIWTPSCTKDESCTRGKEPSPPHPNCDDISRYDNDGYKSIEFTYYCLNGQYVSYIYVSRDVCSRWHQESVYRSTGICK